MSARSTSPGSSRRCWPAASSPSLRWRNSRRRPPSTATTSASFGVKSNLTVPLSVGGASPVGALGFNTTRAERDWPDALVKRLQLVAQVFANALARKRADEALRESEERLALAADSAEAGLWILDYRTGVFWVTDRARAIFGYLAGRGRRHGTSRGFCPSRRLGSRSGSHRAVRASERTRQRGVPDPAGRRPRALDLVPWAAPVHVHRRAGSPDGRLHRHHRAQARPGGAARERGSPGGGRRACRPRVLRGGLRRRRRLHRRPVSRPLRRPPRPGAGAPGLGVLDGASASRRPPPRAGRCASSCTTGGWSGSSSSIASCLRAEGRSGSSTSAGVASARRHRTRGHVVRRPPRHHRAQARRGRAARPEPAPDRRPRGGAGAARARAARRREPAARRAGDRRRPRRARRAGRGAGRGDAGGPRGPRAPQRGHPLPGVPAAPVDPGGARPGRGAAGGVRTARAPGPARPLGGPRAAARRHRQGRGALPVPRRAGGAQQRGPPRRRARRERHAAADGRRVAARRLATTASASIRRIPERGCTSASRACASACGW